MRGFLATPCGVRGTKVRPHAWRRDDLTTGWDFNKEEHRRDAEAYVDKEDPLVLIGSPPCVARSQLQSLSPESENKAKQLAEGIRHMEFVVRLYKKQIDAGRFFIHENPAHAKSWALPCI